MTLAPLVQLAMFFLLSQHIHIPKNSIARVAIFLREYGSFGWEFADREGRVGGSDRAWSEVRHRAVSAHVSEKLLDAHVDVELLDVDILVNNS
jgi:hypothetical protein